MAAQAAVAAVRKGCEFLSEGKAEIKKLKSTIEGGVADAKAIYSEVTNLWNWIKSLFGVQQSKAKNKVDVKKTDSLKDEYKPKPASQLTYEEYQTQAIHEVCEQLKTFFEIRRRLKQHCRELEEISLTTETVEDSAIDRVEIELQLENMTVQIREAMVYAPVELRNIYSRFLAMYDQILEEQEFARQVKKKEERLEAAKQWQRRDKQIEMIVTVVATVVLLLMVAGIMLNLKSQASSRSSFWQTSSYMLPSQYL